MIFQNTSEFLPILAKLTTIVLRVVPLSLIDFKWLLNFKTWSSISFQNKFVPVFIWLKIEAIRAKSSCENYYF